MGHARVHSICYQREAYRFAARCAENMVLISVDRKASRCSQVYAVQVWPYLLGYYKFGATPDDCSAQDEAARHQYETTVSEWLAVEAIVMQCDREALEANVARLSAEQNAAAAATSSAEAAVRSAAAAMELAADEGVEADGPPESATSDDGGLQDATTAGAAAAATATPQRGAKIRGQMMRLTDDGFGGSLSSDGGSKQDTPVAVVADGVASASTNDAGRRQKFFVTNPTVDDTLTSSSAAAAATEAATDVNRCSLTHLPSDGTCTTACCFFAYH